MGRDVRKSKAGRVLDGRTYDEKPPRGRFALSRMTGDRKAMLAEAVARIG